MFEGIFSAENRSETIKLRRKRMMQTLRRSTWKPGLAVLAILVLCVAAVIFDKPADAKNGKSLGLSKLEPTLELLDDSNVDQYLAAGFIVQFLEDEAITGPASSMMISFLRTLTRFKFLKTFFSM